ncbi:MAG: ABC transporter substrate-binding protein [Chloroflexi bacterium]|nr:ABC transporter substrate-binding protein [Chloroflexota bacterium]
MSPKVTRRSFLRTSAAVAGGGLLVPVLAACGQAPTPTPVPPPKPAAPAPTAAPAKPAAPAPTAAPPKPTVAPTPTTAPTAVPKPTVAVKPTAPPAKAQITIWHPWRAAIGGPQIEKFINDFNKKSTTTEVINEYQADLGKKIMAAAAGNTLSGILWGGDMFRLALGGQVRELGDYAKSSKLIDLSQFNAGLVDLYTIKGKLYGLPIEMSNRAMWIREDLMKAAGLTTPKEDWTWDGFVEFAGKMTKSEGGKVVQWGTDGVFFGGAMMTINWLWSNGADFFNQDETKVVVNSPEAVETLQFLVDLGQKHKVAPPGSQFLYQDGFESKRLAITYAGPWMWGRWIGELKIPIVAQQYPRKKKPASAIGGAPLYVAKAGKAKEDASWEFLEAFLSTDANAEWAATTGYLPVRKDSGATPRYLNYVKEQAPQMAPHYAALAYGRPSPGQRLLEFGKIAAIYQAEYEAMLNLKKPVKQALDEVAKQANANAALFKKLDD